MPNVRDSSATIGTTRGPTSLSRNSAVIKRTNAIVVEIVAVAGALELRREDRSRRDGQRRRTLRRRCGTLPSAATRSRR